MIDVALKVLPDAFAGDPDRLARFTGEAQTLASLNRPNIAHIHGLGVSWGVARSDLRALLPDCRLGRSWGRLCSSVSSSRAVRTWLPGTALIRASLATPSDTHTTATLTLWIGGSELNRQSHCSPPSRPIQS